MTGVLLPAAYYDRPCMDHEHSPMIPLVTRYCRLSRSVAVSSPDAALAEITSPGRRSYGSARMISPNATSLEPSFAPGSRRWSHRHGSSLGILGTGYSTWKLNLRLHPYRGFEV